LAYVSSSRQEFDGPFPPPRFPPVERPQTPPDSFENQTTLSNSDENQQEEFMRTLYFGNLPPDISISEFLNYIRGGDIEEVKYIKQKSCIFVTFLDAGVAASVFVDYQSNAFGIQGYECRIGFGKPSALNTSISSAVTAGASRNVFIGNLEPSVTAEFLEIECSRFGQVDTVNMIPDKNMAFVHMCSVVSAIRAVSLLSSDPRWASRRISYGKDRCSHQSVVFAPPTLVEENRTVYIGGVHPDVQCKDLCDVRDLFFFFINY
jgi:RNA recognition motif-containing protein